MSRESLKEMVHEVAKQLFHEVIAETCSQLSIATVNARHCLMLNSDYLSNELINNFVSQFIRFSPLTLLLFTSLSYARL